MSALPAILLFPSPGQSSRRVEGSRTPIPNIDGEDVRPLLEAAALDAGIPLELIAAGAMAESGMNPKAERWGGWTLTAKHCIETGELSALQWIIDQAWKDVSFGYSQRIVAYSWTGNGRPTVENCLAVRSAVFADPGRDLREMASHLAVDLAAVSPELGLGPVDGDELLAALVIYNAGHYPFPGDSWWKRWAGNVASYRAALTWARQLVAW